MDDPIVADAQSARAYAKAVRRERRSRTLQRWRRKAANAWKYEDFSDYFANSVVPHVAYNDDFDVFLWRNKRGANSGELRIKDGSPQAVGSTRIDDFSGSALFHNDGQIHSLARFAWWYHHGYDCGAPEHFPHTGGCRLVDTSDPQMIAKENLQTKFDYLAALETNEAAAYRTNLREQSAKYSFQKAWRLVTAIQRCKQNNYTDPLRELVNEDDDLILFQKFTLAPNFEGIYHRNTNGQRADYWSQNKRVVSVEYKRPPAANVLWYMVTGTFIGKAVFRNGDPDDLRLTNITDKVVPNASSPKGTTRQRVREIAAKMRRKRGK